MNRKGAKLAGWMCFAVAVSLAVQLWPGGKKGDLESAAGDRPPVTKRFPRDRGFRESFAKDPREEFEAARKRGMTEKEVRWVVEEFLGSGISATSELFRPTQELLESRKVQQRWYLDTLVDGFGLTGEQKKIAKIRLRTALSEDHEAYVKTESEGDAITVYQTTGNPFLSVVDPFFMEGELIEIHSAPRMLNVSLWLGMGKLAPWDLCELDEGQRAISWFGSESVGQSGRPMGARTKDAGTDDHYADLDDPFAENLLTFTAAGAIFPLSMGQVDRMRAASKTYRVSNDSGVKRPGLIDEVKFLTSPQLRTLLLFCPEMAEELMKELGE